MPFLPKDPEGSLSSSVPNAAVTSNVTSLYLQSLHKVTLVWLPTRKQDLFYIPPYPSPSSQDPNSQKIQIPKPSSYLYIIE